MKTNFLPLEKDICYNWKLMVMVKEEKHLGVPYYSALLYIQWGNNMQWICMYRMYHLPLWEVQCSPDIFINLWIFFNAVGFWRASMISLSYFWVIFFKEMWVSNYSGPVSRPMPGNPVTRNMRKRLLESDKLAGQYSEIIVELNVERKISWRADSILT